jgi:hypothetical protein
MESIFLFKKSLTRICTHPSSLKAGRKTKHALRLCAPPKSNRPCLLFSPAFLHKADFPGKEDIFRCQIKRIKSEEEINVEHFYIFTF